ncbi:MAG TPA: TonB-dependent receptor, partial [Candidatus Dormibacteraeota bacterium]|nr:TonB-dependent receptor [Candidatus Dormibacteraeota bacterium]
LFARNSVFDARNAFATTNPDLNRRFVEASLGGPLPGKSGSFFIAGQRLMNDQSSVVNSLDTVSLNGPLDINVPTPQRRDHLFARTSWALTEMQSLSLNYTFSDQSSKNNGVGALVLPEQGFGMSRHTHRVQVIDSVEFSPELRNEATFVFKNQEDQRGSPANGPEILVNGAFVGGPAQSFDGKVRRAFDVQDTATYIRGKHSFLFGATVRNDWWSVFDATNFGGTFTFNSLAEYTNVVQNNVGTPDLFQVNQGNPRVSFLAQQTSGFAQDSIRVLPNLSATFGLRYDWQNTLDDRKDVAPRIAFAYTPGKQKRTVLRAGAGTFYDNLPRTATQDVLLLNGVRSLELDISNPSYPNPFLSGQNASPPPSVTRLAANAQSPYLIQASAGIEEEVWKGSWLSLEYSLLHGVHLLRLRDVNAPLPASGGLRPDPNFSNIEQIESTAFLRGRALTLTFRGGWGKYFKGYGQYVLSHYTNDVSTNGPGGFLFPADNYNLQAEIGPADFDRRHRLNFAGVIQLPRGFRMGTILSAASGAPFDITTGSDPFGDTISRPPGVTRNTGHGPGMVELDLRVTKVFSLERAAGREGRHLRRNVELSADAFNAINHTNVTSIIGVVSSPLFAQADAASPARTIQLSAKYSF